MLVLARKEGESIAIGGGIRVVVVRTRSGEVRLGIDAPRDVSVVRGELENEWRNRDGREEAAPVANTT